MIRCEICSERATWCCAGLDVPAVYFCDDCAPAHINTCEQRKQGLAQAVIMGGKANANDKAGEQ